MSDANPLNDTRPPPAVPYVAPIVSSLPPEMTAPSYPASPMTVGVVPVMPVTHQPPVVEVVADGERGGMRQVSRGGYYQSPDMGTAVVVPSADAGRRQLNGFDPDAPQRQLVVDTQHGINVVGEIPAGPHAPPVPPVQPPPQAAPVAPPAAGARQPSLSIPTSTGDIRVTGDFVVDHESAPAPRPKIGGRPPTPDGVRPPKQEVVVKWGKLTFQLRYHEVLVNKSSLVLIYDTRYDAAPPPPEFEPTEEGERLTIRVARSAAAGRAGVDLELACEYYDISYVDELQREHVVLTIDWASSKDLLNPQPPR